MILSLCGTASGSLFGLSRGGEVRWECPTGDAVNKHTVLLRRGSSPPLILCTGEWGNLHAIDLEGRHVWTHLFRTKTRAAPVVGEVDGSGRRQIFLPAFNQHLYVFDEDGGLADDIRLSGIMPSAPDADPRSVRAAESDLLGNHHHLAGLPAPARTCAIALRANGRTQAGQPESPASRSKAGKAGRSRCRIPTARCST